MLRFRDLGVFVFEFGCFVFDLGCFVFEFSVLRFRDLGASCFGLRFRVLRFRNYPPQTPFVGRDERRAPLKTPAWEAMLVQT